MMPMMKIAGIVAVALSILLRPAFAQSIPLVNPQQLQIPAVGGDLNNLISAMNGSAKAGGVATFYVAPIAGDNAPQLAKAIAGNAHTVLTPGYYQVCSQIEVPRYKHVSALDTESYQGGGSPGFVPAYPVVANTVVGANGCPNGGNGSFAASGQGFFHLHDNTVIEGFVIQGQRQVGGHNQINCINAQNGVSLEIAHMLWVDCYYDVDRRSSATPGDQGTLSQEARIHDNTSYYNEVNSIYCIVGSGGNGCTDEYYANNEIEVPLLNGINCTCSQSQFIGNRIEDGGTGIIASGSQLVVSNNFFNRISPIIFAGHESIVSGNKMSGTEPGNTQYALDIFQPVGSNAYANIVTGNLFDYNFIAAIRVNAGAFLQASAYNSNRSMAQPMFVDARSAAAVLAQTPSTLSTFALDLATGLGFDGTWNTTSATLTTLTAAGPTGDNVAARLLETATTNFHLAIYSFGDTLTPANTYTKMAAFAAGSSGTRNAGISMGDGTNSAVAIFTPGTCAFVASAVSGAGAVVGTPSAVSIGNGWCAGAVSFTGLGASSKPAVELDSGSTRSYLGDGTSNLLFVDGPIAAGQVSPSIWRIQP